MLGIVAIGRNEGERLKACLESIAHLGQPIVYVDSGSTDGSPEFAGDRGVHVVALNMAIPFTAGLARNAGFDCLVKNHPETRYVQFVDGDCVVCQGWLETAVRFLESHSAYAIVCGQLSERYRDASIYNRLMALEWDTPVGDAPACGGIFAIRASAFQEVNGFNPSIIAGEEPELCLRLRQKGWSIRRLSDPMVLHDAAMTRFSQWWKRAKRAGHAYAEGAALHGKTNFRHKIREVRSSLFWGGLVPAFAILTAFAGFLWPNAWLGTVAAIIGWGFMILRVTQSSRRRGWSAADSLLYAFFCALSKPAAFLGICQYWWNQWRGQRSKLIEYKGKGA